MIASTAVLKKQALFGGLSEEQIENIISLMVKETYSADTCIISEGCPNDKIYFMLEGSVSVIKGNTSIATLIAGNLFGEMEVLDVMPSSATIKAQTDVTTMVLSNDALRRIYRNDIKVFTLLLMNLAREISRRLRSSNQKLSVLMEYPAGPQR